MARFRLFLMGTTQAPVLDVVASNLYELNKAMEHRRFLEGQMVEIDGCGVNCGVLIPTSRIQMISEIEL